MTGASEKRICAQRLACALRTGTPLMAKDILVVPQLTRRDILKLSAAAGLAWSLPWLPGCGDDGGNGGSVEPPPLDGREMRSLHLDLSNYNPDAVYCINAIGSRSNFAAFSPHTDETRDLLRGASPHFNGVQDDRLTHYLGDIDLPADRVQHIWITQEDPDGTNTIVLSTIYVPRYFRVQVARLMASGMVGGVPHKGGNLVELADSNLRISARDAAIAVVYHNPQLVRLDTMQAGIVRALIDSSGALDLLEDHIYSLGSRWIVKVPAFDETGAPLLDPNGNQYIQQDPSDETMDVADQVIADALSLVSNEMSLEGANWHLNSGRTTETQASLQGADPEIVLAGVDNGFIAKPRYTKGCTLHGVVIDDFSVDQAARTVNLSVKNTWLRFVGAYVEFFDAGGQHVFPYGSSADKGDFTQLDLPIGQIYELTTHRCLNVAATNTDYLGIPFREVDIVPAHLPVHFPPRASKAKITFGTLGLGDPFTQVSVLGASATLVVNIGIPTFFLAAAIGSASVSSFAEIFKDPKTLAQVVAMLPLSIYQSSTAKDARPALYTFGKLLLGICLRGIPVLAAKLALELGSATVAQAVPVVGWIVKGARIGAAIAELSQTIYEATTSPAAFENDIDLVMNTTVKINHDPGNFQFPATAKRYVIRAVYDQSVSHEIKGTLSTTRSEPIVELLREIPAGGEATIDVWFFTENDWIAGHGTTGSFTNTPELAASKEITIKENLVPLNDKTRYSHKQKLALQNGAHVWQEASAPQQTRFGLNCDTDSLCDLDGITVSQGAAAAGYAWQARGSSDLCGSGPSTGPVHRIQSVSIAENPEAGLKTGNCGYTGKPLLAYELIAAAGSSSPRSFYLDPSGDGFHLRSLPLGGSGVIDQTTRLSWGEFSQPIDSIAVHPSGFVVGVNTQNHRLEIITLRTAPVADERATVAALKGGRGTRVGLLDTPIAVGVDLMSGAVLVLEGGSTRRVQAFDCFGNQVLRFDKQKSATMDLRATGSAAVEYLDMAVESTGYIYVLSFQGSGNAPADYRVDIYNPNGDWLSQTGGVAAARLAVDKWRNLFTLNYETLRGSRGPEPSISEWIPSTPRGCDPAENPFCERPDSSEL